MNKILWFFLKKTGFLRRYINRLWENRIDLIDAWKSNQSIKRIDIIERGYPQNKIKSYSDLFPAGFPFQNLKNTHAPDYQFQDKYVYEVENAVLAGPYALGISQEGRVIRDMIAFTDGRFHTFMRGSFRQVPGVMLRSTVPLKRYSTSSLNLKFDTACVLHSAWNNYYHWITEHLPKLRGVKVYNVIMNRKVKIIIPPDSPGYVSETLKCFGINEDDIYEWNSHLAEVNRLIVPTFPEITFKTAAWLKEYIYSSLNINTSERKKRIYISRSDANVRRISNEEEMIQFLKIYGFQSYRLSGMSFTDQVCLFSDAEIVIAPHGAGLTNIIWADKINVIELFGNQLSYHYARIADACNHEYNAIICEPDNINSTDLKVSTKRIEDIFHRMNISRRDPL